MNAITERYLWLILGIIIYALALILFQPQSWQDIALSLFAGDHLSLPATWFYHFKEPDLLQLSNFIHPQIPLISLLWKLLSAANKHLIVHVANILLLGSALLRSKSTALLLLASFAGIQQGVPVFNALLFATVALPHNQETYWKTALRYLLLTLLAPIAALAGLLMLCLRIYHLRYLTIAALLATTIAIIILTYLLHLSFFLLVKLAFTVYWTRFFAKMQPWWVFVQNYALEIWLLTAASLLLIIIRIFFEKKSPRSYEQTPFPHLLLIELLLFFLLPWVISLGQSWSLLLLLPARMAIDGRLTTNKIFQTTSLLAILSLLGITLQRTTPPEINIKLPAALAVGIDDLHGHDDLLLVRHASCRIYILDLKVVPDNYILAQTGITDDSGNMHYLFSTAARRFFIAEQKYAENLLETFANEPERGILLSSGINPLQEKKPFSRARHILEQYHGTKLFWVKD